MGQFTGCLKYRKHSSQETVYVVKGLIMNLLGLSAIITFQLIQRVYATYNQKPDVVKRFLKSFRGSLPNNLKENASPYSLLVHRNIPIPYRPNVKEELFFMEKVGVISKIITPTPWCMLVRWLLSKKVRRREDMC